MNRVLVIPVKDGVSSYLIPSVKVAVDVLGLSESLIRNIIMTGKPVRTSKGCDVFLDYEIEDTLGDPEPEVVAKKRIKEKHACELISQKTGEVYKFKNINQAAVFIGRRHCYTTDRMSKGQIVESENGTVYATKMIEPKEEK